MTMTRWLAPLALALAFAFAPAPARAQATEEAPPEESGGGRPFDGYFASIFFIGGALFVVGKSARR